MAIQPTRSHIKVFHGQMNQFESGSAFPTQREMDEYLVGNGSGIDDGDAYYVSANDVLGIRVGSAWQMIEFTR